MKIHCSVRVALSLLSLLLVGWTTADIAQRSRMAGGCGCAGECVVYEEEDRFECLCSNYTPTSSDCDRSDSDCFYDEYHYYYSGDGVCHCPNDTRLAPDLRDCYHSERISIEYTSSAPGRIDLGFSGISFDEKSYRIYGLNALIRQHVAGDKREVSQHNMEGEYASVLLFIGENDDIVLVSSTVVDLGGFRVRNISRVIELENGTLTVTDYTSFLETPVVVTGAVHAYARTASVSIGSGNSLIFHISARKVETHSRPDYEKITANLYNTSSPENAFLCGLLNIMEREEPPTSSPEPVLLGLSIAVGIGVGIVLVIIVNTPVVFTCIKWRSRSKKYDSRTDAALHMKNDPGSACTTDHESCDMTQSSKAQ